MHVDQMRRLVFRCRPRLKRIYQKFGRETVAEYAAKVYAESKPAAPGVVEVIAQVTERILGPQAAQSVRESLRKSNYLSTVDHHGPISHASFFQPNVLRMLLDREHGRPATIVLSCSSVSLNNHSFPRGLYWHDEQGETRRLPLFGTEYRRSCVYGQPSFSRSEALSLLEQAKACPEVFEKLRPIFREERLFTLGNYRSQISLINFRLMEALSLGSSSFVSLPIEEIAREILLTEHFSGKTPLSPLIFHERGRNIFLKETHGIATSHNLADEHTTVLFWGLHEGLRIPLRIQGNTLVDENKKIRIFLEKEEVFKALREERIFPNLALCLIILSYHGLVLGGGFSQVDYLPLLIKKSRRAFLKIGSRRFLGKKGDFLGGDFHFLPQRSGEEMTAGDFLQRPLQESEIRQWAQQITLAEAIERIIPDVYKIVASSQKKKTACHFCGNSQTSHLFSWISTGASIVVVDPLARRLFRTRGGRLLFRIAREILLLFYTLLRWGKVVKLNPERARVPNSTAKVLFDDALRRGWKIETLMVYDKAIDVYRVTLPGQIPFFFSGLPRPEIDESPAMGWMDDKALLKRALSRAGIPVPRGESFGSWRSAKRFFDQSNVPLIVKPRLGSRGRHTTTHLTQEKDFKKAFFIAKQMSPFVIVEEHLEGSVYRATLINGSLVGVLAGDPPRITGDGTHTVRELMNKKNRERDKRVSEVVVTENLISFLNRQGYTLEDVLAKGQGLDLSEKIGVRYGGKSREVTPEVHPKLRTILERGAAVVDDPVIGFDFITQDVSVDPESVRWGIIECNAMPFINLHHDPLEGEPVNVAGFLWDYVYQNRRA